MDIQQMKSIADGIRANVEKVIVGKSHVIELVLAAMLAEGHVLLEDVPVPGTSSKSTCPSCSHAGRRTCAFGRCSGNGKNNDGQGIGEVH